MTTARGMLRAALVAGLLTSVTAGTATGTAVAAPTPHARHACDWTPRDLGALPGPSYSQALGTDGGHRFAGFSQGENSISHATAWFGGRLIDIGAPYGAETIARDVNRAGYVVGTAGRPQGTDLVHAQAFLHHRGRTVPLAVPAGITDTEAWAINNAGTIVGFGRGGTSPSVGLVWSVRHPDQVRVVSVPGRPTRLLGVNQHGVAVGDSGVPTVSEAAITWSARTGIRWLDTDPDAESSTANAAAGRFVAGQWFAPADEPSSAGIRWDRGVPHVLAGPGMAVAVNSRGVAVGSWFGTAIVWRSPTDRRELDALGGPGLAAGAHAVTETGQVAGWSRTVDGLVHATVWSCR